MTTEAKCLEYARECARRAKLVSNPELRKRLLNIALNWTHRATREPSDAKAHELADEGSRVGKSPSPPLAPRD